MDDFDLNAALDLAASFGGIVFLLGLFLVAVIIRGRQVFDGLGSMIKTILEGWAALIAAKTERKRIDHIHRREAERLKSRRG